MDTLKLKPRRERGYNAIAWQGDPHYAVAFVNAYGADRDHYSDWTALGALNQLDFLYGPTIGARSVTVTRVD